MNKVLGEKNRKKMTKRNRLISIIHQQKKRVGLSDDEYRYIIFTETNENSCSVCTIFQLEQVYRTLNRLLIQKGLAPYHFRYALSLADVVEAKSEKLFGKNWQERIQGFMLAKNLPPLNKCTDKDLRMILGFLSTIERSQK